MLCIEYAPSKHGAKYASLHHTKQAWHETISPLIGNALPTSRALSASAISRDAITQRYVTVRPPPCLSAHMRRLLEVSYDKMHKMFAKTYGYIYLSHSNLFKQFFTELQQYFRGDIENIGKRIDSFFNVLRVSDRELCAFSSKNHFLDFLLKLWKCESLSL